MGFDFRYSSTIGGRRDVRELSLDPSDNRLPNQIRQSPDNGLNLYKSDDT